MMRSYSFVLVMLCVAGSFTSAQVLSHVNFSAGAGFSVPQYQAGDALDTGWNVNFRGGVNVSPQLAADLDFTYNRSNLNAATLARLGEPNGDASIWSLTFNPVIKLAPSRNSVQPYITAGYGLYHRNVTLTQPAVVPALVCDPFFGFCITTPVGVNQVVASNSTLKTGFNAGLGFNFRLGDRRAKIFTEARYH